jgi:DNA-binding transcriptional ArsR family regulator
MWSENAVFAMLADPVRRRLLQALASGLPLSASALKEDSGRRLDAVLKHLTALRGSGLVVAAEDATDRRRQLYSLPPYVTVRSIERGQEIDFGCAVLRVWHS